MKALEDQSFEIIKAHILDPENSALPENLAIQFNRIKTAIQLLDRYPRNKHSIKMMRLKYPSLSQAQAYRDIALAKRLFNSVHTFDYDFYHTWLINSILKNIEQCRSTGKSVDKKIIQGEHANLIKALGERPDQDIDPDRNSKHQYNIQINLNGNVVDIDLNKLQGFPQQTIQQLTKALISQQEMSPEQAQNLIEYDNTSD